MNSPPVTTRRGLLACLVLATLAVSFTPLRQALRARERAARRAGSQVLNFLPPGTRADLDLEYAKVGGRSLRLDLYRPRSGDHWPLLVWVHGGGYVAGDKGDPNPALALMADGFAVASVEYRFSQVATFPAQIHDCKAAVRYLRANADRFGLDPERFGAWGASAGGHLVALLGTSGLKRNLEGEVGVTGVSSEVHAVCDYFGPSDFMAIPREARPGTRFEYKAALDLITRLLGGPLEQKRELAGSANPLRYASPKSPPYLILHGDQDEVVPLEQSQLLEKGLKQAGVEVALIQIAGAGHSVPEPLGVNAARQFFIRHLRRK